MPKQRKKRAKTTPAQVLRGVFERKALVTLQAIKFTEPYRAAWKRIVDKYGEDPVRRALDRLRKAPSPASSAVEHDLLRLARNFYLPTRVPVDPSKLEDLPSPAQAAGKARGWWGPEALGVHVNRLLRKDGRANGVVRVDLDFMHPDTELVAGLELLRETLRIQRQARPEDLGLTPLEQQPEDLATTYFRVDASLWRNAGDLEQAVGLLRLRTEAPLAPSARSKKVVDGRVLPKAGRTLRETGWDGPTGWNRAFHILYVSRPPHSWSDRRIAEWELGRAWRPSEVAAQRQAEADVKRLRKRAERRVKSVQREVLAMLGAREFARQALKAGIPFEHAD